MQKYPDLSNPRFLEPKDNLNQWLFSLDLLYISKGFNFNPDFRFLSCIMIRVTLDDRSSSRSSQRDAPKVTEGLPTLTSDQFNYLS